MKPPLLDALEKQIGAGRARFHMPGHKGILPPPLCEAAAYDFTELPLTGSLFEGIGPMAETERAFSAFYNSGASLLSAGGSTLCIQAMLALGALPGGKIAAGRNCHAAAVNAMALLGLEPVWLYPDEPSGTALPGRVSPALVGRALRENPDLQAVYLTSPDYFGVLCDVEAIAEIYHRRRVPLLVDNAHGAHLAFFGLHPMALGADLCCDSLHKTLPALTGAALLHLRDGARAEEARARMALFGSTSPSYLILLSADLLAARMQQLRGPFQRLALRVRALQSRAREKRIWAAARSALADPVRVSLAFPDGMREDAIARVEGAGIEAEYVSSRQIVLLPAPEQDLSPIESLIDALPPLPKAGETSDFEALPRPERALPLREALFAAGERIPVSKAQGRINRQMIAPCPPGLPIVMPGERIDDKCVKSLQRYGVRECFVV